MTPYRTVSDDEYVGRYEAECREYRDEAGTTSGQMALNGPLDEWAAEKDSTSLGRWNLWRAYALSHKPLHVVEADGTLTSWDWRELFR